jgi:shikimate dehydrogenase
MATAKDTAEIQACIRNPLDQNAIGKKLIAGIVGDAPSHYSKSPALWNAAFRAFDIDAAYLPFDVDESRLSDLIRALKKSERVIGINVTVPYKLKILDYLDALDEKAARIKAVNTVVRTQDGRLVGYNTDGSGFLQSIASARPGRQRPFVESLKGMDVLLIGAGGSARAVAFHLADVLGKGRLLIANRTAETARDLAQELETVIPNAKAIHEEEIFEEAPEVGLIVNCSIKGQGGVRKIEGGQCTILEPYSALAPAHPAVFPESDYGEPYFYRNWLDASLSDIEVNNRASWDLSLSIPPETRFYDLIYFPAETVFLRHGRLSGHPTLNGQGMIVAQAVESLYRKVCRDSFQKLGISKDETYRRLFEAMDEAWRQS